MGSGCHSSNFFFFEKKMGGLDGTRQFSLSEWNRIMEVKSMKD